MIQVTIISGDRAPGVAAGAVAQADAFGQGGHAAGALVEAQTLLTEVWGPEFGKERNYLRVYMSQLRSKLEADPARPQYLHTQMGIGYRFTP